MPEIKGKYLIVLLQGFKYAVDLAQVAEVCDPPQLSPIPLAPCEYVGALNFHGDIFAAINLSQFIDLPGSVTPGKMIVLRQEIAALAFLVDSVIKIVSEEDVVDSAPNSSWFAAAILSLHDSEIIQLDLEALASEAEKLLQKN